MEEIDEKIKKTDNTIINGFEFLFDKINTLLEDEEKESFALNAYYFDLGKFEFSYSTYIKVIREIHSALLELLGKTEELFYFEKGKFYSINYEGQITKNKNAEIINKIRAKKIVSEEFNSLSVKQAAVKGPEEAENFDGLMEILEEKINKQNKFIFPPNPNSIIINRKEDYLDKVEKRSTQLFLIAKNDNIEVIKQHILEDKTFQISAGAEEGSFELFYILEGAVSSKDKEIALRAGDSIAVRNGEEERYFETLSDTTLLYITKNPIFASEQKRINDLMALNEKISEKDNETKEHCARLQKLSRLTALELELDKEKLFNLGFASFLHDIGKAKVPKELLQKPGKLTDEEWGIMKKHPFWGKEIVLEKFNNSHFIRVAEIINQHHERYDGTGYPEGLKEDEILIEAKILTVVDAYDAMVYERPYQRALSREEAIKEIQSEKGKQFAPLVVEAFLKVEKKFIERN